MVPLIDRFEQLRNKRKLSTGEDLETLRRMLDRYGEFRAIKKRIIQSSLKTSLGWPCIQLEEFMWDDIKRLQLQKGFDPEWIRERDGQYGLKGFAYNDGIPCEFEEIIITYDGQERMAFPIPVRQGGKCGLVMADGIATPVTEFQYDLLFRIPFTEYVKYVAFRDGKYGLVETDGREVVPCQMDEIYHCPELGTRIIPVRKGDKWGFYYEPCDFVEPRFDELVLPYDDYLQVRMKDQWGWVADDGRFTMDKSKAFFRHDADWDETD